MLGSVGKTIANSSRAGGRAGGNAGGQCARHNGDDCAFHRCACGGSYCYAGFAGGYGACAHADNRGERGSDNSAHRSASALYGDGDRGCDGDCDNNACASYAIAGSVANGCR